MHLAAEFGQTENCTCLIKCGGDINAKENNGWTPLHFAAYGKVKPKLHLLLSKRGRILISAKDKYGGTPLHWAAWKGHTEITAFALVKAGANWYIRDNEGETALQVAIDKHGKEALSHFPCRMLWKKQT